MPLFKWIKQYENIDVHALCCKTLNIFTINALYDQNVLPHRGERPWNLPWRLKGTIRYYCHNKYIYGLWSSKCLNVHCASGVSIFYFVSWNSVWECWNPITAVVRQIVSLRNYSRKVNSFNILLGYEDRVLIRWICVGSNSIGHGPDSIRNFLGELSDWTETNRSVSQGSVLGSLPINML